VAQSAFHSLFRRIRGGDFQKLQNRDHFWRLLSKITRRKAISHHRKLTRLKRGGGKVRDEAALLDLGQTSFLAFATVRAGFHVPLVVPAAAVPEDVVAAHARGAWTRGEPFVLESHSTRWPSDPTNIEIRPFTEVLEETFDASVTYGSGTLTFAPFSRLREAPPPVARGCQSATLGRLALQGSCVQVPSTGDWWRCEDGAWSASSESDAACDAVYPAN